MQLYLYKKVKFPLLSFQPTLEKQNQSFTTCLNVMGIRPGRQGIQGPSPSKERDRTVTRVGLILDWSTELRPQTPSSNTHDTLILNATFETIFMYIRNIKCDEQAESHQLLLQKKHLTNEFGSSQKWLNPTF